jgi:hypothetical protein
MPKTPFRYAVTFENSTLPPLTIRGETIASSTQAGARLAVKDAMFRAPGRRWTSCRLSLRPTLPITRRRSNGRHGWWESAGEVVRAAPGA